MTETRSLRSRMLSKELTIGSWLSFGYEQTAEIMARAGYDWMVLDLEHGAIDMGQARRLIQVLDLAGCVPLVRVASNDLTMIKQALDSGAEGVVVPMVNTADQARAAVAASHYPPHGTRGVGLARAQGYGMEFDRYRDRAQSETIVLVQIEHITAVENLDAILAVDGVDGFMVGPYDLSGSVGHPGDFDHPAVRSAFEEITRVMRASGKAAGYHVVQPDTVLLSKRIGEGYSIIAYGDDMLFFANTVAAEYRNLAAVVKHES